MLQIENNTPFETYIHHFVNENDKDTLYTIVKGTFAISPDVKLAESQIAVNFEDEFWGTPGESSIKYASDLNLKKPSTDIIMIGDACAPDYQKVISLDTSISVAKKTKRIKVWGHREWVRDIFGYRSSMPMPFQRMPMTYENAFGGTHSVNSKKSIILYEPNNPVGKGFIGKRNKKEILGMPLPNLDDPKNPLKKPKNNPSPACYGFTAPNWMPRMAYAGTYDEAWQKKRAPYLPDNFDTRFFNMAHQDLIYNAYLKGGEPVEINGMSPMGTLKFNLPVCQIDIAVSIEKTTVPSEVNLETIVFEPGENRFTMLWRSAVEADKGIVHVDKSTVTLNKITY